MYFEQPYEESGSDPLLWWKIHEAASPNLQEWQGGTVVNLLQVCHQSGCSVRGELSLIPFIVDWHLNTLVSYQRTRQ